MPGQSLNPRRQEHVTVILHHHFDLFANFLKDEIKVKLADILQMLQFPYRCAIKGKRHLSGILQHYHQVKNRRTAYIPGEIQFIHKSVKGVPLMIKSGIIGGHYTRQQIAKTVITPHLIPQSQRIQVEADLRLQVRMGTSRNRRTYHQILLTGIAEYQHPHQTQKQGKQAGTPRGGQQPQLVCQRFLQMEVHDSPGVSLNQRSGKISGKIQYGQRACQFPKPVSSIGLCIVCRKGKVLPCSKVAVLYRKWQQVRI